MTIAKSFKFNFKSRSIKDENGKEIGRTKKQPSVECEIPVLDAADIYAYLQQPDSKEASLILDQLARISYDAAREQFDEIIDAFGDDDTKEVSVAMLDYSRLDFSYLANLPPAQRGAAALTEEDWTAFYADYLQVMVAATGKTEERIKNHINLFKKPQKAKANKEVLQVLVDQLEIYLASSANLEETGVAASRVIEKFKRWTVEPEKVIAADML